MGPVGLLVPGQQDKFNEVLTSLDASWVHNGLGRCHHGGRAVGVTGATVKIEPKNVGAHAVRAGNHRLVDGLVVIGWRLLEGRPMAAAVSIRCGRELQRQQCEHQKSQEQTHS